MDPVITSSIIFILVGFVLVPIILSKSKTVLTTLAVFALTSANFIQFGLVADLWPFWSTGIGYIVVAITTIIIVGIKAIIDARSE